MIEERNASGTLLDKYIHGANIDEILVRYNGGAIYYHHDGLGSVTHLTDGTGAVVESYTYDVYGAVSVFDSTGNPQPSSLVAQRFLFTGREWLPQLGLYDYRNRILLPSLGRFMQADPVGFQANDVNLYRYCANAPTYYVDPFGLYSLSIAGEKITVDVGECEVVILISHGSRRNPPRLNYNSSCSAGAFIGCWPGSVNTDPVHSLPHAQTHDERMKVYKNLKEDIRENQNQVSNLQGMETDVAKNLQQLIADAIKQSRKMAQDCCPNGVSVSIIDLTTVWFNF